MEKLSKLTWWKWLMHKIWYDLACTDVHLFYSVVLQNHLRSGQQTATGILNKELPAFCLMNKLKPLLFTLLMLSTGAGAFALSAEITGKSGAEEKVYVVVTATLILIITIFFYLFRIDRKQTKMEEI